MPPHLLLAIAAILPFLGSAAAIVLPANGMRSSTTSMPTLRLVPGMTNSPSITRSIASSRILVVCLACIGLLYPAVSASGSSVVWAAHWLPTLGVQIVLRLDGLAWLFAVLVLGIGALVVLYARYYMAAADPVPRLFSYFLAFVGAMLGIVLSGNLIQLVVFWELTSIVSFLLIGYWTDNASARDGARMALTITAAGGLCLFVGMVLLGQIVGSYDLGVVLASGDTIRSSPLYLPALVLVLAGALTKSAQFPFHIWLPRAMAAPTPISAYLHSATMVKAGIFLMIRFWPVLAGTESWYWIVGTAGMATMLVGAWSAIFQHDLKGLLAYSTISHLGLITLLLGLDSPLAVVAAMIYGIALAGYIAVPTMMTAQAPDRQGQVMAAYSLGAGASAAVGPLIGTLLIGPIGIEGVIWVYAVMHLISAFLCLSIKSAGDGLPATDVQPRLTGRTADAQGF